MDARMYLVQGLCVFCRRVGGYGVLRAESEILRGVPGITQKLATTARRPPAPLIARGSPAPRLRKESPHRTANFESFRPPRRLFPPPRLVKLPRARSELALPPILSILYIPSKKSPLSLSPRLRVSAGISRWVAALPRYETVVTATAHGLPASAQPASASGNRSSPAPAAASARRILPPRSPTSAGSRAIHA